MILLMLACSSEAPIAPARVEATAFAQSPTWVRDVAADSTHVYWTNYDNSSGKSDRAVLQRAPVAGGSTQELASEAHPPEHLAVHGGFLYWSYAHGSLKRVPVTGGQPQRLFDDSTKCFSVDDDGVFFIKGVALTQLDPSSGSSRVLVDKALGDCPVALGEHVYWLERTTINRVPKTGGTAEVFAKLKKCESLIVHGDALYTCYDDKVTRLDPDTGDHSWVRGYCKGPDLQVADGVHWFPQDHFEGWPPVKQTRLVEVTKDGPSYLFDGTGASSAVVVGERLAWFGDKNGSGWTGLTAPLPTP